MEVGQLAGLNVYEDDVPCAGVVAGIGLVNGVMCMIVANDATVKGGTYYPLTVKKHLRAQEIAKENRLPCIYLVDSGGAFLPLQDQVFPDKEHFGRIFYNQAQMSKLGIPQIAVVMGSCTAGGAYVPAMSDETIIVRNQGTIFLGGPPLVKAATGEVVSSEDLGGGDVHTRLSGVADHLAENDEHALLIARNIVANLNYPKQSLPKEFDEPLFDSDELYGVVPADAKTPFDIREVIMRLTDGSRFDEFKARFGTTLVTGFAEIYGQKVGIIANNGILFSESAQKARISSSCAVSARFHCCSYRTSQALWSVKNTKTKASPSTGPSLSWRSPPRTCRRLRWSSAVHSALVTTACVVARIRHALCGHGQTRISVMGGEQAASVLSTIKREQIEGAGGTWSAEEENTFKNPIREQYEHQGHPYYASARLWDDGVIDPAQSRHVLGLSLAIAMNAPIDEMSFGVFRM